MNTNKPSHSADFMERSRALMGERLEDAYRRELRVYLRRYRGLREEIELESSTPQPARERRHHKRADRPVPQEN